MDSTQELKADAVIAAYLTVRRKKERLVAQHKEELKLYDNQLDKFEAWLLTKMNADNLNSCPTDAGTAYIATKQSASVTDMDAFLDYVKSEGAWHLLEKRVSTRGVREILDEDKPLPPGVDWFSKLEVNVRKPTER